MKTGNKEASLERLNNNPYRLTRLVMFPNVSQAQFCDSIVPGQLSRQMLRNVELGLPTTPPENLTYILSHHGANSLYYQDPDRLLSDYKMFQLHTRQATGHIFGDPDYTDVGFRYLEHASPEFNQKPRILNTMHPYGVTELASLLCYPLQQLQRLNHISRPAPVGDSFRRVLMDMGYSTPWIDQLAKNHEAAIRLSKKRKVVFS